MAHTYLLITAMKEAGVTCEDVEAWLLNVFTRRAVKTQLVVVIIANPNDREPHQRECSLVEVWLRRRLMRV